MSNKLKVVQAHGIAPTWRLVWWNYTGYHGWIGGRPNRKLKKFLTPPPQVVEFYSEALARRHIEELRRELGPDNVVCKLRELAR